MIIPPTSADPKAKKRRMGKASRTKGLSYERELLQLIRNQGLSARRCAASGAQFGYVGDIELTLDGQTLAIESKFSRSDRGAKIIRGYLKPCDMVWSRSPGEDWMTSVGSKLMLKLLRDSHALATIRAGFADPGAQPAPFEEPVVPVDGIHYPLTDEVVDRTKPSPPRMYDKRTTAAIAQAEGEAAVLLGREQRNTFEELLRTMSEIQAELKERMGQPAVPESLPTPEPVVEPAATDWYWSKD